VKRAITAISIFAAAVAVSPPGGSARPLTTQPGYNFKIDVTITKGGQCTMTRTLARRGWRAHFIIFNNDSRPHSFDVGGRHPTTAIPPHTTVRLGASLELRGTYPFKVDGKVRGYFHVL
jgi:hypothetical protein